MGRVIKPGQKQAKAKRQTFSHSENYMHVKFHDARTSRTMGSICKRKDLGKNSGETEIKQRGIETTLSFGRSILAGAVATSVRD